jgi:hypothetical protein
MTTNKNLDVYSDILQENIDNPKEKLRSDELNIFLTEVMDMDRIDVRRKVELLENYINNLKEKM